MSEKLRTAGARLRALAEDTLAGVARDRVATLAAAMSFWLLVTIAPLVLAITRVYESLARPGSELARLAGELGFNAIDIEASDIVGSAFGWAGPYASVFTLLLVITGAIVVFSQFVDAVEIIWSQPHDRAAWTVWVRSRLLGFVLLIVTAIALVIVPVAGAVVSSFLSALQQVVGEGFAGDIGFPSLTVGRSAIVLVAAWLFMVAAMKVIPRRRPRMRDILPGTLLTAVAFTVGDAVLSNYLASTHRYDVYGALESFIAMLVWVYYAALIVLVGAVLCRVLDEHARSRAAAGRPHDASSSGDA